MYCRDCLKWATNRCHFDRLLISCTLEACHISIQAETVLLTEWLHHGMMACVPFLHVQLLCWQTSSSCQRSFIDLLLLHTETAPFCLPISFALRCLPHVSLSLHCPQFTIPSSRPFISLHTISPSFPVFFSFWIQCSSICSLPFSLYCFSLYLLFCVTLLILNVMADVM